MPGFKLGGVTPDNVKMGSDQADKIYMGSTLVWEYTPIGDRIACRFVAGPAYFDTDGAANHAWNTTYGLDNVNVVNNVGISLDFDTTINRDAFLAAMSSAGLRFRFDPDGELSGPVDSPFPAIIKSDWSTSGTSITTGSAAALDQLTLLQTDWGLSPSTNFTLQLTFA